MNSISWSITTTVFFPAKDLNKSAVNSVSSSVRPATGSSTNISEGFCPRSIAISSHCFWPWDNEPALIVDELVKLMTFSNFSISCFFSLVASFVISLNVDAPWLTENSRFSSTVKFSKILGLWNFLPTPTLAILCSFLPINEFPLNNTSPKFGFTFPVITSRKVVLPAPLGPIIALNSPSLRDIFNSFRAKNPSKLTLTFLSSNKFLFFIIPPLLSQFDLIWGMSLIFLKK